MTTMCAHKNMVISSQVAIVKCYFNFPSHVQLFACRCLSLFVKEKRKREREREKENERRLKLAPGFCSWKERTQIAHTHS